MTFVPNRLRLFKIRGMPEVSTQAWRAFICSSTSLRDSRITRCSWVPSRSWSCWQSSCTSLAKWVGTHAIRAEIRNRVLENRVV
jgi:hypothetical protein